MKLVLGSIYRDQYTGVEGWATARTEHVSGKVQVLIESVDGDGNPREWWFDEVRLVQPDQPKSVGLAR